MLNKSKNQLFWLNCVKVAFLPISSARDHLRRQWTSCTGTDGNKPFRLKIWHVFSFSSSFTILPGWEPVMDRSSDDDNNPTPNVLPSHPARQVELWQWYKWIRFSRWSWIPIPGTWWIDFGLSYLDICTNALVPSQDNHRARHDVGLFWAVWAHRE